MNYCVLQDLIDRYGENELIQLSDHDNVGEIDQDAINRAIGDADGEIDGYLSGRYDLPINPVPKVLVRIACDIARYYLYDDQATEQVTKRYSDAVKFLERVAAGKSSIGVDASGDKPSSSNEVQMDGGETVFNRDDKNFI